jgi:membrane-bound metal-dependent hydrolase YbcI (DUF457 family)
MDPATHLLASYTLARAGRARVASPEMTAFLIAGLAPDLDWLWHLPEPLAPLRAYGTATHSLAGAVALAAAIAGGVWLAARKRQKESPRLARLFFAAFLSACAHLLLDLCSTTGIELYWPLRSSRVSWNLIAGFDAILLVVLAGCGLLAALFGLVTEEIGARRDSRPPRGWPVTALVLVLLYFGFRAVLHERAEKMLGDAQYNGTPARHWAAFPDGTNPFTWRGVVETDSLLAEVEVPIGVGGPFSPGNAAMHYKPEPSPLVDAAAAASLARAYTALARFPVLTLESMPDGTRAQLTELGDSVLRARGGAWRAVIELDAQSRVAHQELHYDAIRAP